jgi:hypothetical protein
MHLVAFWLMDKDMYDYMAAPGYPKSLSFSSRYVVIFHMTLVAWFECSKFTAWRRHVNSKVCRLRHDTLLLFQMPLVACFCSQKREAEARNQGHLKNLCCECQLLPCCPEPWSCGLFYRALVDEKRSSKLQAANLGAVC